MPPLVRGRRLSNRPHHACALVALVVLLAGACEENSQPQYAGLPSTALNYVAASQQTEVWCWAASVQMILNWYGVQVTQSQIVTRVFGAPIPVAGNEAAISAALSGWGFNASGKQVTISSRWAPGPPPAEVLVEELKQQHPILLGYNSSPNSGQAVVITGVGYTESLFDGPSITQLIIRDPYPTPVNVQNVGRVQIDMEALSRFVPSIRGHWLVRVQ